MHPDPGSVGLEEALGADFIARHPTEAARVLEGLELAQVARMLGSGPPGALARIVEVANPDWAARLIRLLDPEQLAALVPRVDLQLLASLVARMEPEDREAQLAAMGDAEADEIRELMKYPPGSAGFLMDPRATVFHEDETIERALAILRGLQRPVGAAVQVVDASNRLLGELAVQSLIAADPGTRVGMLAHPAAAVRSVAGLDEVLEAGQASRGEVSVVDIDGHLLGVIARSRLTAAAEQEASADLQAMVGVSREERALSSPGFAVRKRLPWLFINLATAFLAAGVVGVFESTIAQVTALAVLLPVVAGQSGNSGSQALAVTMRGLALREVRTSQWRRVGVKEVVVGFLNGVAVALVTAVGVLVWSGSLGLGLVIAAAMVISMAMAGLAGAAIPMTLKALGQDPAQSSSIFLTTVTDIVGFTSFLGLATLFASLL